jgi:hypothetical protein
MELRKDGFLYAFAYAWASNPPEKTSLCRFFWRLILSLCFGWPLVVPFCFFFMSRIPTRNGLTEWRSGPFNRDFPPIAPLVFGGFACVIAFGMGFVALAPFGITHIPPSPTDDWRGVAAVFGIIGWLLVIGYLVGLGVFACKDAVEKRRRTLPFKPSELRPANVLWTYLRAKRERVCPIIKIV